MAWLDGTVKEKREKDAHPYMKGRTYRIAKDQHGRPWGAECDNRTNDPVGPLSPKFAAPWLPTYQYVEWHYDREEGQFTVHVNYRKLNADRRRQDTEWTQRLMEVGTQLDGQAFDPANPTLAVMLKTGPRPESVVLAIKAERGDPWLLGLAPAEPHPAWALPFFPPAVSADDAALEALDEQLAGVGAGDAPPAPIKKGRRSAA